MNSNRRIPASVLAFLVSVPLAAEPASNLLAQAEGVAPPTPPPVVHADDVPSPEPKLHSAANLYSIGDPTPEEQLYVEMINRARANPTAEADIFATTTDAQVLQNYDFFDVDLGLMQSQFAEISVAQPVAPNAQLTAAARRHSEDMLENAFQGHEGSDGSTFAQRIQDTGYVYSTIAENVYSYAHSVFHGHAGFEVDWGFGPGGMQTPPGHRNNIHAPNFREVGIGVIFGENEVSGQNPVGPQLVSQEFGTRQGATPLVTGVVYFDLNDNDFYDAGEGIGGVRVVVSGTSTQAVTALSGGYAVPVAGNGSYTVTFSGTGVASFSSQATVSALQNVKVDFSPAYVPPVVSGPANPATNSANAYIVSAVPAAKSYQWRRFELTAPPVEGAENGTNSVAVAQSGTYNVFEPGVKTSGAYSFHLAHPANGIVEQSITLRPRFLLSTNAALKFQSRLGFATTEQFATVHISLDDGATWQELYRQAGVSTAEDQSPGETSFQARTINLAAFVGKIVQFRLAYLPTGLAFTSTSTSTGWLIDDITLENGSVISNEAISDAPNASFSFQPASLTTFVLQGRARTGHDYLPWGPMLSVQSVRENSTPRQVSISSLAVANNQLRLDFDLVSGAAPASWVLQSKTSIELPWTNLNAAAETISATHFRFTLPFGITTARQFFRVQAN